MRENYDSPATRIEQIHQHVNICIRTDNFHHFLELVYIYDTILVIIDSLKLLVEFEDLLVVSLNTVLQNAFLKFLESQHIISKFVIPQSVDNKVDLLPFKIHEQQDLLRLIDGDFGAFILAEVLSELLVIF